MSPTLKTLIEKLDRTCRRAAERAASLCVTHGHFEVALEHLLLALVEQSDCDLMVIARRAGISAGALHTALEQELATLRTGNTRTPVFASHIPELLEKAWLIASTEQGVGTIRSANLLLALLTDPALKPLALRACPQLQQLPVEDLKHRLDSLTEQSCENAELTPAPASGNDAGQASPSASKGTIPPRARTPALDQYTVALTRLAREGALDPVIGRETEVRQVIDILMRRRQNNPILTGEAGVGKTAVVEGLALRIAAGDVPPALLGVEIHTLDMGLLQAGASVKGEFEQRLKNVIQEVRESSIPIVLFIDEAHTIIGAGGAAGQNDAANLLKPALARGELRTIGATTWSEYKQYFEKDAALTRRFQVVKVEEPAEDTAINMVRGLSGAMSRHFGVRVLDSAIEAAVRLSRRYIAGRQLPDKAISVLDTACARVALSQNATPAPIENLRKQIEAMHTEVTALDREASGGNLWLSRRNTLRHDMQQLRDQLTEFEQRWRQESRLIAEVSAQRAELERLHAAEPVTTALAAGAESWPPTSASTSIHQVRAELESARQRLHALQGESPLIPLEVDTHIIAEVVSAWTGVPLGRMLRDDIRNVRSLQAQMGERVIGQDHALAEISGRVRMARAGLEDPQRPQGVFLLVGPSGVGKTETALTLAETLYGGERQLLTINMSEFQEAHSVAGLKGAPPGYVGYGSGGVLTEAVRRNPYCAILLDEIEKAHPDVIELFYQVFDKGRMDDAEGREIDFRNTVILLTSNVGAATITQACLNQTPQTRPSAEELAEQIKPALYRAFKPAFLGRCTVVPYFPIDDDTLHRIVRLKLSRIGERLEAQHSAGFEYTAAVVDAIFTRCTEVDSGARNVDHIINAQLLPPLADLILERIAEGTPITHVQVDCDESSGQFASRLQ